MARALGIDTFKMHHGHRGGNHPVKNLMTGKCEISTQNHGFAVDFEQLKSSPLVELTHINLNDETVEGFRVVGKNALDMDLEVNVTKGKKLTNMRASGSDSSIILTPPKEVTLDFALEYIGPDELAEVTPKSIRIRKKYLTLNERKKNK